MKRTTSMSSLGSASDIEYRNPKFKQRLSENIPSIKVEEVGQGAAIEKVQEGQGAAVASQTTNDILSLDSHFLQHCFLCKCKLDLDKDIYMYKGNIAFCSIGCRDQQILSDRFQQILSNRFEEKRNKEKDEKGNKENVDAYKQASNKENVDSNSESSSNI